MTPVRGTGRNALCSSDIVGLAQANIAAADEHASMARVDAVIVGGGIVGLASALALLGRRPGASVVVLEKEPGLAAHQTGRNSGVVHAGLYYKPGPLKATLCTRGRGLLERFCEEHGVPLERCGKVVVATSEEELPRLAELERRAREN